MKAERDILTKVGHPFVVQLRYSFQVGNCQFAISVPIIVAIFVCF
jgi:hypothetical protein